MGKSLDYYFKDISFEHFDEACRVFRAEIMMFIYENKDKELFKWFLSRMIAKNNNIIRSNSNDVSYIQEDPELTVRNIEYCDNKNLYDRFTDIKIRESINRNIFYTQTLYVKIRVNEYEGTKVYKIVDVDIEDLINYEELGSSWKSICIKSKLKARKEKIEKEINSCKLKIQELTKELEKNE